MFSSRYAISNIFRRNKISGGGGGGVRKMGGGGHTIFFLEKQLFLISCFFMLFPTFLKCIFFGGNIEK